MALPPWAIEAWAKAQPYADKLAVWRGYEQDLQTLLIYGAGIAIFTMLVFAFFCQKLSKRDSLHSGLAKGTGFGSFVRFMESALVFPMVSFLFLGVLAASLFLLAKQSTYQILLLSMSIVVAVRMTSFVSEVAAADLAKLMPLSLLGVLIVDPSYASLERTWAHYQALPGYFPLLGRYFLLFIVLEAAMRLGRTIMARAATPKKRPHHLGKAELIPTGPSRSVPLKEAREAPHDP